MVVTTGSLNATAMLWMAISMERLSSTSSIETPDSTSTLIRGLSTQNRTAGDVPLSAIRRSAATATRPATVHYGRFTQGSSSQTWRLSQSIETRVCYDLIVVSLIINNLTTSKTCSHLEGTKPVRL